HFIWNIALIQISMRTLASLQISYVYIEQQDVEKVQKLHQKPLFSLLHNITLVYSYYYAYYCNMIYFIYINAFGHSQPLIPLLDSFKSQWLATVANSRKAFIATVAMQNLIFLLTMCQLFLEIISNDTNQAFAWLKFGWLYI